MFHRHQGKSVIRQNIHNYSRRNNKWIDIPYNRIEISQKSMKCVWCLNLYYLILSILFKIYIKLPVDIILLPIKLFKNKLLRFWLNYLFILCRIFLNPINFQCNKLYLLGYFEIDLLLLIWPVNIFVLHRTTNFVLICLLYLVCYYIDCTVC